jgi:hypothetical protein
MQRRPELSIPIPDPLPTNLTALRESTTLMEDVWITRTEGKVPRWLQDSDVRDGIRAMLKADRCREEHQRLTREAENLSRWFREELAAIEGAVRMPASKLSRLRGRHKLIYYR